VLYIEDERVQAYFFINKCKRVFGDTCTVVHEQDGVAALERLQRGEQFDVIVSDIFMAGMDGVSFFCRLFTTYLNIQKLHPEGVDEADMRLNLILTAADLNPGDYNDAELTDELAALTDNHGVLVYNKTSGVDIVLDVIKPHITYVETQLARHAATVRRRRGSRGSRGSDGGSSAGSRRTSIGSVGDRFVTTNAQNREGKNGHAVNRRGVSFDSRPSDLAGAAVPRAPSSTAQNTSLSVPAFFGVPEGSPGSPGEP